MCGGLQNSMDLGETVPSVCSETLAILSSDGSEVSYMRAEEILHAQEEEEEEDHLTVALPVVKAVYEVCYVCNIVVLTVVQACTLAGICILAVCCVVFRCDFMVKREVVCCLETLYPPMRLNTVTCNVTV